MWRDGSGLLTRLQREAFDAAKRRAVAGVDKVTRRLLHAVTVPAGEACRRLVVTEVRLPVVSECAPALVEPESLRRLWLCWRW